MTTAKLNATGLRWVAQLANFVFSLKFRRGIHHTDADYMSRVPTFGANIHEIMEDAEVKMKTDDVSIVLSATKVGRDVTTADIGMLTLEGEVPVTVSREELAKQQQRDDVIGPIYRKLKGEEVNVKELGKKSMILWKQRAKLFFRGDVLSRQTKLYTQQVLPEMYQNLVYQELHSKLGHIGSEKVLDLARRRFYWPNMQTDVEFFVRKKCRCIIDKKPNVAERAPLVPIKATRPWEIISMDFLHLDRSKGGCEYALVVCDHFTRYTQIYATRNNKAPTVADKI